MDYGGRAVAVWPVVHLCLLLSCCAPARGGDGASTILHDHRLRAWLAQGVFARLATQRGGPSAVVQVCTVSPESDVRRGLRTGTYAAGGPSHHGG